jgi:predicted MFS family arabinose efflux permease
MLGSPPRVDTKPSAGLRDRAGHRSVPAADAGHIVGGRRQLESPRTPYREVHSLQVSGSSRSKLRLQLPLVVLATGTFAIGTDAFVIGGVLPAVARSLGVSISSAGFLVTAFAVAYAIGAPILAVAGGRLARRTLLVSALVVFVVANVLAAVAPSYGMVLIARVLAALAASAFVPAASAAASSLVPTAYRGRALATVVAGMTVAQVVGVPFGALVGALLGWRYTFMFIAATAAVAALAIRLWLPPVQSPAAAALGQRLRAAVRPSTWPLLLQTSLAMAAGFSVLTYIGPVLNRAGGYHGAMISMALLVFGVASVAGSTLGGRLTDTFGAFPVVVGGLAALVLAMVAISAATALAAGWPALAALAAWGLGGWTFLPSQQHRLVAAAPDKASLMLGLNSSAIYLGAAIGGAVGGLVLPANPAFVPAIAAGLAACAIICVAAQHHFGPATRHGPLQTMKEENPRCQGVVDLNQNDRSDTDSGVEDGQRGSARVKPLRNDCAAADGRQHYRSPRRGDEFAPGSVLDRKCVECPEQEDVEPVLDNRHPGLVIRSK